MMTAKPEACETTEFFMSPNRMLSSREILALTPDEINVLSNTQFKSLEDRLRRALKKQECQLVKNRRRHPLSAEPDYRLLGMDVLLRAAMSWM